MADLTPITKDGIFMDDVSIGDKIESIKPIKPIKPIRMPKFTAMRSMAEYSIPTPVTRKEMYLNVIAGGVSALPTPITREEIYLAKICGMDVAIPIPLTRYEMYLYKLAGGEWDVPTPVTRIEKYLYHNCGYEIETPKPVTREEIYWNGGQPTPTTIEGIPPLTFTAKRTGALVDYRIDGNTVQSGTPTPENPIMPEGTGERTENLFDIDNVLEDYYLRNGVPTEYHIGGYVLSDYIPIASDTATISAKCTVISDSGAHWAVYDENKTFIRGGLAFTAKSVPTTKVLDTSGAAFIRVDYALECLTDCMLNLGSTALPYEPYGYKIPISSANVTTPIYLGEVETTRKIRKLVLTGSENLTITSLDANRTVCQLTNLGCASALCLCTHIKGKRSYSSNEYNRILTYTELNGALYISIEKGLVGSSLETFNAYLAAQYANGTPVTVWYVLATEETAVVNEPLCKIGDYADSVDFSQAGVEIPVTAGENTVSVGTTIQPSNMMISYK